MQSTSIASLLRALNIGLPDNITADSSYDLIVVGGGRYVEKSVQLNPGGAGAQTEDVFSIAGHVRILQIYAVCTAEAEGPNVTFSNCKFSIYDGANTVDMCAVVNASGIEPNDLLIKTQDDASALTWMDADNAGIYTEGGTEKPAFFEGVALQKTATNTYIRFSYTSDANTDVTLNFVVRWQPLISTSTIEAT